MRLISATNRNLIDDVKHGRFREDLFYRLHVFPITVPPLAERPEDIPDLAWHFLARFSAEEGKRIRAVTPAALALLRGYAWPGNVRQLENAVFRAVVLAESDELGAAEFPQIEAQLTGYRQLQAPVDEAGGPAVVSGLAARACRRPSERPRRRSWYPMRTMRRRSALSPCSMPTAMSGRSKRSRTRRFASPSPIAAGRCRTSRAGCGSAARPSIASSRSSDSTPKRPVKRAKTWRPGDRVSGKHQTPSRND